MFRSVASVTLLSVPPPITDSASVPFEVSVLPPPMISAPPPVTTRLVRPTVDRLVLAWFSVIAPVRFTTPLPLCTILPSALALKASPRFRMPPDTAMPLVTAPVFVQVPVPETAARCTVPLLTLMLPVLLMPPRYQVLPETLAFSTPWKLIVSSSW